MKRMKKVDLVKGFGFADVERAIYLLAWKTFSTSCGKEWVPIDAENVEIFLVWLKDKSESGF